MRHGRAKAARKTLKFYAINANLKAPYKIILDGNFLAATVQQKVPLFDRLHKLLQGSEFQIHTTRSALDELDALPGEMFQEARQFGLDECEIIERCYIPGGAKKDSNPKQDIKALVRNNNTEGWFVATQDEDLSDKIRGYVNVPQLRLARAVLLLEAPSSASRKYAMLEEKDKQMSGGGTMTHDERELIEKMKDVERKDLEEKEQLADDGGQQRRKRKAKGPNPLSCKKKKGAADTSAPETKKRNRRKKNSSSQLGQDA